MKQFKFDYDEENDDLFIYLDGSKSNGAVEIGNFVIDFDKDENFVALELTDASKILSKLLAKIIELNKIRELKAEAMNFRNMASIKLKITTDSETETANIIIPTVRENSPAISY
jgi:uncharacterized protein YuzE